MDRDAIATTNNAVVNGEEMALSELTFGTLLADDIATDVAVEARVLGELVERALCAGGRPAAERAAIDLVTLEGYRACDAQVARICSAIAEAKTARQLNFVIDFFETHHRVRAWVWQWLAFAFFPSHARNRSSITHARLSRVLMTEDDAEAIATVLLSPNPLRCLLQRQNVVSGNEAVMMLKAGAPVRLLRMHEEEEELPDKSSRWKLTTDISGITVVSETDPNAKSVHVIVPGYGLCEVGAVDVIPVADAPLSTGAGGVTSLGLEFGLHHEAATGLERFLEAVGSSLTRLELTFYSETSEWMASVLRYCPNLRVCWCLASASTPTSL